MAEMSEISKLAVDYLFGDRSVFASEEEFSAFVRQLGGAIAEVSAAGGGAGEAQGLYGSGVHPAGDQYGPADMTMYDRRG